MLRTTLTEQEVQEIQAIAERLCKRFPSVEDPAFLSEASLSAHELPRRLRAFLLNFKNSEPESGICLVSGFPIDQSRIGPTPKSWNSRSTPPPTLPEEIAFFLMGQIVGDPIGWATQQDGYLVHDILPMPGYEHEQLGCGSEEVLAWHTEDAFHPYRGDHLALMCLRNPDQVATTIGSLAGTQLSERHRQLLFEPHFTIRPDESHLPKNASNGNGSNGDGHDKGNGHEVSQKRISSYDRIQRMWDQPARIAVLFGDPDSPYLRLDPFFMDPVKDRPEAQEALDALVEAIDRNLEEVVFQPGDICFIDNYRVVHGRKPFRARYDGQDRWLKRLNITRDLRKSRDAREKAESRVLN